MRYAFKTLTLCVSMAFLTHTYAAGDIESGRQKAETCLGCHAQPNYVNVYPTYRVPKLAGQHPEYIISALQAYKNGSRKHNTMHANASNLSDQDMVDIAAFLSSAK